jgi:ribosomal protein L11 methylase PrmA
MALVILLLQLLFIGLVVAFVWPFFTSGLGYAPSTDSIMEKMIRLANIKPGEKAVDIGAGDGRLVIALAKAGAEAHGYEINPVLVLIGRIKIRNAGLQGKAFMHCKSFWKTDFSPYSVVTLFAVKYLMARFETKLMHELKPGSRVLTNFFTFPQWPSEATEKGVTLYLKR